MLVPFRIGINYLWPIILLEQFEPFLSFDRREEQQHLIHPEALLKWFCNHPELPPSVFFLAEDSASMAINDVESMAINQSRQFFLIVLLSYALSIS